MDRIAGSILKRNAQKRKRYLGKWKTKGDWKNVTQRSKKIRSCPELLLLTIWFQDLPTDIDYELLEQVIRPQDPKLEGHFLISCG